LWRNVSYASTFGVFIRDAAHGQVVGNKTFGNCAGILFLNTDETAAPPGEGPPGPPVDTQDWTAKHNSATANNKSCTGEGDEPPFGGIGIVVAGAADVRLLGNGVFGNVQAAGSPFGGGILVVASDEFTPPKPSTGVTVAFNVAFGNAPADLVWDGAGAGNVFVHNRCATSQPDGLCAAGHGGGGGGAVHGNRDHHKHDKHHD
jgi:hypothetical protein